MNSIPTTPPNMFRKVFEAVIHVPQRVQITIRQKNQMKSKIAFMLFKLNRYTRIYIHKKRR